MKKTKPARLFRVASKFNVSTATIIDILSSEGFELVNRPTTKVNEDMLNLLDDYFSNDFSTNVISPANSSNSENKVKSN
jgi:hypothetical protein